MTLSFLDTHEDLSNFEVKTSGVIQVKTEAPVMAVVEHMKTPTIQLLGFILQKIGKVDLEQEAFYSLGTPSIGSEPGSFNVPITVYFPKV